MSAHPRPAAGRRRTAAASTALLVGLTACGGPAAPEARSIGQADLEDQVARMYPPENAATTVRVTCEGALPAQVGASEECQVKVDRTRAVVRVAVTRLEGAEVRIAAVPVLSAEKVAEELLEALLEEGFDVDRVRCPDGLLGEVDDEVSCRVTPSRGRGEVVARVARVQGLQVRLDYEVAG